MILDNEYKDKIEKQNKKKNWKMIKPFYNMPTNNLRKIKYIMKIIGVKKLELYIKA